MKMDSGSQINLTREERWDKDDVLKRSFYVPPGMKSQSGL